MHADYKVAADETIIHLLKKVMASTWNLRAFQEREGLDRSHIRRSPRRVDHRTVYAGAILQQGIPFDISFVCFSKNPGTGKDDGKVYINAVRGLGPVLMDAERYPGDPAIWVYDKRAKTFSMSPSKKQVALVGPPRRAVYLYPLEHELRGPA